MLSACASECVPACVMLTNVYCCRLLGFGVIALAVLYWLTRRNSRTARRPNQGRLGGDVHSAPAPTVVLKPGFQRVPVQNKVSLVSNDSLFDSSELLSIDTTANSVAATATPSPELRILPSGHCSRHEPLRAAID